MGEKRGRKGERTGGGVQVLNLAEFRVTFSVGAERIVGKEDGVTRQKIQEKFPRGEVVQRSVGITPPRLFNPIDATRFPLSSPFVQIFLRGQHCVASRKIARYSLFIRGEKKGKPGEGKGKKKEKKSNQLNFAKDINLELA